MSVYYRGASAHITHEVFLARSVFEQSFAISELHDVHVEICGRRGRTYELHAVYRGRPVCLYRTSDLTLFGQIRRALLRALENNSDTV